MLVLTRKQKETIKIGDSITITILRLKGQAVRVGIEAPRDVRVVRGELNNAADDQLNESETEQLAAVAEEANPQVVQFRFSPQKTTTPVNVRGPLSNFLTNLHTPGFVAETVTR